MMSRNAAVWLGAAVVVMAALAMTVWVPMDSTSAPLETVRGRVRIGDAMAPTVALALCALGGLITILEAWREPTAEHVTRRNMGFLILMMAILGGSLLLMRYAGPFTVWAWNGLTDGEAAYRNLRDTAPWKYIGFLIGGTIMVAAPIALVERRLTAKAVLIGVLSVVVMIVAYDLPFDDLLLPPNGDI